MANPPTEVTVRVYVIRGRDLRTSDPTGLSRSVPHSQPTLSQEEVRQSRRQG